MLRIPLLITLLIILPFALPICIIGLVKYYDKKNKPQMLPQYGGGFINNMNNVPLSSGNASAENKPEKHDMTVSNVLFLIGTIFVVLSGLAFGVASWVHTSHIGRVSIIAAAALVTFMLSAVVLKFLRLSGTSVSFYILGTGFAATAFLTASYYKLLGTWLTFNGGGFFAVLSFSTALVAVLLFTGFRFFNKNVMFYTAVSAVHVTVYFSVLQIFSTFESRSITLYIIATAIVMVMFGSKLLNGCKYELGFKIIGSVSALFFGMISLMYVFSVLRHPTVYAYAIIILSIAQFTLYGIRYKNMALIAVESIISILFSYMFAMSVIETADNRYGTIVFGMLSIIIYAVHCLVKHVKNDATEVITLFTMMISAFTAVFSAGRHGFIPEFIIGIIVSAVFSRYVFHEKKAVQVITGLTAPILPCCIAFSAADFTHSMWKHSFTIVFSIYICVLLAATVFYMYIPGRSFGLCRKTDTVIYVNLAAAGILIFCITVGDKLYFVPIVLCLIHFALSNRVKFNVTALISSFTMILSVYFALNESFSKKSAAMMSIMLALTVSYVLISRFFYHDGFCVNKNGKTIIDPLMSTAWISMILMYEPNRTNGFFTLIALAVYISGYIKKNTSKKGAAGLLTATAVFAAFALMTRPYLVPEFKAVSSKINIAIIVLLGISCRFIWREFKGASKISSETIFIISAIALLFDTLYFDTAENTIFSMTVMIIILMISIMTRSKTWFIASSVSLFTITVYATREYLMALNWWIYLFIAGVILIGLAAGNEYCKKNNETIKTSVVKKFSGWTW